MLFQGFFSLVTRSFFQLSMKIFQRKCGLGTILDLPAKLSVACNLGVAFQPCVFTAQLKYTENKPEIPSLNLKFGH